MMKTLSASALVVDWDLYPRAAVDGTNVGRLADALAGGVVLPPIVVCRESLRVVDGVHRLRAIQRVRGAEARVRAELVSYPDDAALYADAVTRNAAHGSQLTPYDHRRIRVQAEALGRTLADVAQWLRVPVESLERRSLTGTAARVGASPDGRPVPLKRTLAHLDGHHLTPEQISANDRAGGMAQAFYLRQVVLLFECGALDQQSEQVRALVDRLRSLLVAEPTVAAA